MIIKFLWCNTHHIQPRLVWSWIGTALHRNTLPMMQVDCGKHTNALQVYCFLFLFWNATLNTATLLLSLAQQFDWFLGHSIKGGRLMMPHVDVALKEATLLPLETWSQNTAPITETLPQHCKLFLDVASKEATSATGWLFLGCGIKGGNVTNTDEIKKSKGHPSCRNTATNAAGWLYFGMCNWMMPPMLLVDFLLGCSMKGGIDANIHWENGPTLLPPKEIPLMPQVDWFSIVLGMHHWRQSILLSIKVMAAIEILPWHGINSNCTANVVSCCQMLLNNVCYCCQALVTSLEKCNKKVNEIQQHNLQIEIEAILAIVALRA